MNAGELQRPVHTAGPDWNIYLSIYLNYGL